MRNELRFLSNALVYMVDESEKETTASLRDVSQHGLSIKSDNYLEIEPNSPYVIVIVPEKETNIEKFRLDIESKWVKINKSQMESGFSVMVPFGEKEFQDYLEYLAQKNKTAPSAISGHTQTAGGDTPPETFAEDRGSPPDHTGRS